MGSHGWISCYTAVIAFVSTNIDNIFVLMILYAQLQNKIRLIQVIAGQYFGIGILVAVSILGALGTQLFPSQYIRLLGFLPLLLGIKSLINYRQKKNDEESKPEAQKQISFISVALLTVANGADNIGVYIPIFNSYSSADFAITLLIFWGMNALWCYLGLALANYPYIKKKIVKYQHILVPVVLIVLGISILVKK